MASSNTSNTFYYNRFLNMNSLIFLSILLLSSRIGCSSRFGSGAIIRNHQGRRDEPLDLIRVYQRKYQLNYLPQIDLFDDPLRSGMGVEIFGKPSLDSNGLVKNLN